jgi:predicted TIM-barrel fold metal-dependent hydrolase
MLAPFDAEGLIAQLDAAGIRRAVVLSVGYLYGDPRRQIPDHYPLVRAENDWLAQQVRRYPDRLTGFCGFNPLETYALVEMDRCATVLHLRGLKFHMGNSGVDFRNPQHVERVRQVFAAANARRLPVVVHLRTRNPAYGRADAEIFLAQVLPAAPDVVVQVAHLAGAGPGYPAHADEAMAVFAEAIAAGDSRTRNLYFDATTNVTTKTTAENAALIVSRIRQVGVQRVLFGADLATGLPGGNPQPREAWTTFRTMLPLTDAELGAIAANVPPYMR